MRKLPVFAALGEVLSGVVRHYFQLLVAAWPAVLLLLFAVGFIGWLYYSVGYFEALTANEGMPDLAALEAAAIALTAGGSRWALYGAQFLSVAASAVAAVRWHRLVLLGEGANGRGGVVPLRKEDGRYLFALLKILLLCIGGMLLFASVAIAMSMTGSKAFNVVIGVVLSFLYLLMLGFLMRLLLALPDATVGGRGRVFAVFRASSGNTWRLLGLLLLLGFVSTTVIGVAFMAISALANAVGVTSVSSSPAFIVISVFVGLAIYLYFALAQITSLSVAYREIIGLPAETLAQQA